jgi:predicted phage terminase large subunit-like protein
MGFSVYLRKAVEHGKVIFPGNPGIYGFVQHCSEHKFGQKLKCLECLRKSKSAHSFSAQYFNDPVDAESVEFKTEWIRRYQLNGEEVNKLNNLRGILSIDPAVRLKETNDYTGLVVTKITPDKLIYVVEAQQRKISPKELIDEVFNMVALYHVGRVLIETTAAQILFLDLFKNEMVKRNKFFTIEEVKSSTQETKAMRIRGLIPFYANGMILHRPGLTVLEDQLLQFPRNTNDDVLDALSHQVQYWKALPTGSPIVNKAPYGSMNWWKKYHSPDSKSRFEKLFSEFIKDKPNG